MAADESTLGRVHELLGRRAIRMLEKEENEEGELSEAAVANMLKMLKDSNVTMAPSKTNVTGELAGKLAARAKAREPGKAMPQDLQDALDSLGHPSLAVN